jgi:hypothetical protein
MDQQGAVSAALATKTRELNHEQFCRLNRAYGRHRQPCDTHVTRSMQASNQWASTLQILSLACMSPSCTMSLLLYANLSAIFAARHRVDDSRCQMHRGYGGLQLAMFIPAVSLPVQSCGNCRQFPCLAGFIGPITKLRSSTGLHSSCQ